AADLPPLLRGGQGGQVGVGDGVPADLVPGGLQRLELRPRHVAGRVDPCAVDEERRRRSVFGEQRKGVVVLVPRPVVEGQRHDRAGRGARGRRDGGHGEGGRGGQRRREKDEKDSWM